MKSASAAILRNVAMLAIVVAWAVLAHVGSVGAAPPDLSVAIAILPFAAIVGMLVWRSGRLLWIAVGGGLIAWGWPIMRGNIALLYWIQHVGTNLALGAFFGQTLFGGREALVTRFARAAHGGSISPLKTRYTRRVTAAWTLFFVLTALLSTVLFWLSPPTVWSVFANFLTLPLLALMFIGEFLCRRWLLPPEDRSTIADTIRGYRTARRQREATLANHS